MDACYERLLADCAGMRIVNTHCHALPEIEQGTSLAWLLDHAYASWRGVPHAGNRGEYLRRLAGNSYLYWLRRSMAALCDMDALLSEANWTEYDARLAALLARPGARAEILRTVCGYDRIVLDAYWKPGDDDGDPALFAPTYRINAYLFGYSLKARDHNGNSPYAMNGWGAFESLDAYIAAMTDEITRRVAGGCVALKCAIAYDRGLDFEEPTLDEARAGYLNAAASAQQIKAFQDYVFHALCRLAGSLGVPMQVHTGLGLAQRSNAIWLRDVIYRYPETVFSLMHGSYPWTEDVLALAHNCNNVVADICWLPLLSPDVCERFIAAWVDIGDMDRMTWGCDTWHAVESYGAVLAARETLARAFAGIIARGRMDEADALIFMQRILRDNAKAIYRL